MCGGDPTSLNCKFLKVRMILMKKDIKLNTLLFMYKSG